MTAVAAALFIYPVKSAAGIACETVELADAGFRHDREWMIVGPGGRFLTQRELPQLSQLRTRIASGELQLSTTAGTGIAVPLDHEGERVEVQVWGSQCAAFDAGAQTAAFLGDFLQRPARLVRFDAGRRRLSNHDWTQGRDVPTRFPDAFPLLVLSQASIDDLSARVGRTLVVERFRPNLLIEGVAAYAEDAADRLAAGDMQFALTKACTRCVITTLDPATGAREDDEPLATLKRYRHDAALRGVVFGRNAYALAGVGTTLSRGQTLTLE